MAALYQDRTYKLMSTGKIPEAREAAAMAVKYSNSPGGYLTLGLLSYVSGDKETALAALQKGAGMSPDFRKMFDSAAQRPAYKSILEDKEFVGKVFPQK